MARLWSTVPVCHRVAYALRPNIESIGCPLRCQSKKKSRWGLVLEYTHFPSVASGAMAVRYRYYSSTIRVAIRACYYLVGMVALVE